MELTQRGRDIRMSLYMGKHDGIRISMYEYTILRSIKHDIIYIYIYPYGYMRVYACIWVYIYNNVHSVVNLQ